jgi:hypothetical protein
MSKLPTRIKQMLGAPRDTRSKHNEISLSDKMYNHCFDQ